MEVAEQKKVMVPKLRFREFEDAWAKKSIDELDIYVSDGNYGELYPRADAFTQTGVPFIRANNMVNGILSWDDMRFIPVELHATLTSGHLKTGDILVSTRGDIGTLALVNSEFNGANINAQICLLRCNEAGLSIGFTFFALQISNSTKQFVELQTGSALKQLPRKNLVQVKLNLPTLPEQKKIAGFLSAVDEKLKHLNRKKELLQQYKKGVMQKLFSQELRFKREDGSDYEDWEEKRLGEIGDTYNGLTGKTAEDFGKGLPYVNYKQIFDNSRIDPAKFDFVKINEGEKQSKAVYGDVFFTTSSETRIEVGFASVLLDEVEELYLNSFCFGYRIRSFEVLDPEFARYLFRNEMFRKDIIKLGQGSTRYNMSKNEMKRMFVSLPCREEQQKIAAFLSSLDGKIDAVSAQIELTQQFKKGLLQEMFV